MQIEGIDECLQNPINAKKSITAAIMIRSNTLQSTINNRFNLIISSPSKLYPKCSIIMIYERGCTIPLMIVTIVTVQSAIEKVLPTFH